MQDTNLPSSTTESLPAPASPFARVALAVYVLLVIYASWYPFSGWRDAGVHPFAFLFEPLPYYRTVFDEATNVLGYMPLGLLIVFVLYPRVRGIPAVLLASFAGLLLSTSMETVQNYLPSRVASNLDLATNFAGAVAGALIGAATSRFFLGEGRMLRLRQRWFSVEAGRGLTVVALWPLAQIYPLDYLFGHGQIAPLLSDWLSDLLERDIDIGALLRNGHELTVQQYWLAETVITACGLCGAVLTLLCLMRNRAPKAILAACLVASALAVRALAAALQFSPDDAGDWLTPGAQGGLLLGAVMLSGLIFAPASAQRRAAALTLLISLGVVNTVPANPYFAATLQTWAQGKFINFNGAAQCLSVIWPFVALWFLFHRVHRKLG